MPTRQGGVECGLLVGRRWFLINKKDSMIFTHKALIIWSTGTPLESG
jgi:hypothetical protein